MYLAKSRSFVIHVHERRLRIMTIPNALEHHRRHSILPASLPS